MSSKFRQPRATDGSARSQPEGKRGGIVQLAGFFGIIVIAMGLYASAIFTTSGSRLAGPTRAGTSVGARGRVEGVVRSVNKLADLSGVVVILVHDGEEAGRASTDKDGKFVFKEVEPGAFSLTAEKQGVGSGKATGAVDDSASTDVLIELKKPM